MNYAAIYKFSVQSFLLIIHKTEIIGEKKHIKANTHKTIQKSIAKTKATSTRKWQKDLSVYSK